MKKTSICKKLITYTSIACLSMAALFSPVATISVQAAAPASIAPRSDDIRWVFKEENGKLYRRLFNYTKNCWVGEWEYVRDIPN